MQHLKDTEQRTGFDTYMMEKYTPTSTKNYPPIKDCPDLCNSAYPKHVPDQQSWYSTCCDYAKPGDIQTCSDCPRFFGNYKPACYYFSGPFRDSSDSCYGKPFDGACGPDYAMNWAQKKCN